MTNIWRAYTIPKPRHGSAEWQRARWADEHGNRFVNASTMACLFDRHAFVSPADCAGAMLSPTPPPANDDLTVDDPRYRGIMLEDALLTVYEDQAGVRLVRPQVIYVNHRVAANLDGEVPGQYGVECKTTNRYWSGELWDDWTDQGWAQAIAAGYERIEWVILDGRLNIALHTQDCSDAATRQMYLDRVDWWLGFIDMGMFPEGVELTYDAVEAAYPPDEEPLDFDDATAAEVMELGVRRRNVKRAMKELEDQDDFLKARLVDLMRGHTVGRIDGRPVVKWAERKGRRTVDFDKLERFHPEVYREFVKQGKSFRVIDFVKGVLPEEGFDGPDN